MNSNDEGAAQALTERATLHRVERKARPLPGHPRFWNCQDGILFIWLYADSAEAAVDAAKKIIAALPYEWLGDCASVCQIRESTDTVEGDCSEAGGQFQLREQLARESGLALLFGGAEVGDDEAELESACKKIGI